MPAFLSQGVRTVNEIRSERGLPPVSWGDRPYTQARETVRDNLDEPNDTPARTGK